MYDAKKAKLQEESTRFERLLRDGDPDVRSAGEQYLASLSDLIDTFHRGPAADQRVMDVDTTGELSRTEETVAWAEEERHRLMKRLRDLH